MSDPTPNGKAAGVFGTLGQVVRRLSPEFLGMAVLNAVFVGGLVWLFAQQNVSRERVLTPLIAACAGSVPLAAIRELSKPGSDDGISREAIQRVASVEEANRGQSAQLDDLRKELHGGVSQETVAELRRQLSDARDEVRSLRNAVETLRGEIARQTSVRLKGPER